MNKFEKQLEKWNNGLLRGAQAKLAKYLQVSTATVALWATGKRHPSKGFIAKMADLFGLDEHTVVRLFSTGIQQPLIDFSPARKVYSLRDAAMHTLPYEGEISYTPRPEDFVKLPVFTKWPKKFPIYNPKDVKTWWYIPKTFATNTNFLFLLPCKQDPQRILFVCPSPIWEKQCLMLGKKGKDYILVHVQHKNGQTILQTEKGLTLLPEMVKPIGFVVKQVVNLK